MTATRSPDDVNVLPQSVSILTGDAFQDIASRTPNQALREEPGIFSVQVASQGSPIIRGEIGNKVLYLWDGIRINNGALFSGPNGFFNQFPIGSVDRMEVIRGPGAVQFGSDAVGGVINILPHPAETFADPSKAGGELFTQYGSVDGEKTSAARFWVSGPRFTAVGDVSGQAVGDYAAPGLGHLANTSFNGAGANTSMAYRVTGRQTARVSWIHERRFDIDTYTQSELNADGVPRIYGPFEQRGVLKLDYDFNDLSRWSRDLKLYSYYQYYDSARNTTVDSAATRNRTVGYTDQSIWGGGVQNTFFLGDNHITMGADYRTESLGTTKDLFTTTFATGNVVLTNPNGNVPNGDYNVGDAFAIASFHPCARLNITAGARFDTTHLISYPRPIDPLPPFTLQSMTMDKRWNSGIWNAGGVLKIAGGLNFVANAATGFRAPTFSDVLSISVPVYASGVASVPSPGVLPEKSLTAEAGLRYATSRVYASVTAYNNHLTNSMMSTAVGTIDIPGIGVVTAMQNTNIDSGYIRGIEAQGSAKLTRNLTLFASYTYTHGMDNYAHVPLRFIPPPFGTGGLRYTPARWHLWAEASLMMADRMRTHAPNDELDAGFSRDPGLGSPSATNPPYRPGFQMPGYAVANLRFGAPVWTRGPAGFDLQVGLNNLLNLRYREAYAQQELLAPGFGAVVGGRFHF
ncbi:MAG TPA: TonB-dependent receptor [Bryobacteraceae bacterium]|nr:TonB-dependent receptor [Bryobacteraceae bacterium]